MNARQGSCYETSDVTVSLCAAIDKQSAVAADTAAELELARQGVGTAIEASLTPFSSLLVMGGRYV